MTKKKELYLIGDTVEWKPTPTIICRGIIHEDNGGNEVDVLCVDINCKKAKTRVNVKRDILTRFNG